MRTRRDRIYPNMEYHLMKQKQFSMIHYTLIFFDPDHSTQENRYIIIGESLTGKILLVSYTERKNKIRIISCRKATKNEKLAYQEG